MEELISKISSYQLFNNLAPGIVFNYMLSKVLNINILEDVSIIEKLIMCYFFGILIGRIGSLIVETGLEKTKIVSRADYKDYVSAIKVDSEIKVLSEVNAMYRNMATVFFVLLAILGIQFIFSDTAMLMIDIFKSHFTNNIKAYISLLSFILFILAYRKQTNYITKRIEQALKKDVGGE